MIFIDCFKEIEEPRTDINVKHNLLDVIFLTITGIVSGCEGWKDIYEFGVAKLAWLRQYRSFKHGIPVDDTIARIISALDPQAFTECFINWANELRCLDGKDSIAIDGKTLRRSYQSSEDKMTALHSVTVWSKAHGLVLAQSRSKGKKNENKTVLELVELLELKNAIITVDAMNSQKKIAAKLQQKQADYVMPIKENHKLFLEEIKDYFKFMENKHAEKLSEARFEETDAGHGRIESRSYTQLRVNELIPAAAHWEGCQTVIQVRRERDLKNKIETQTEYYISSLPVNLTQIANSIRGHWEVENKGHWVLDVVYKEDESRIRREHAAENLAVARRFALNLARLHSQKNSMKGKLKQAMWSDQFRHEIIFGENQSKV